MSEMQTQLRTPHADINDPREVKIRQKIAEEVTSTEFGQKVVVALKKNQIDYFTRALSIIDDPKKVFKETQENLDQVATITMSKIVEGEDLLASLTQGEPAFVALNHLGFNKLVTFSPLEIGFSKGDITAPDGKEVIEIYPFPTYYGPLKPLANKLKLNLSDAHLVLPNPKLARLQEEAGLVVIPETGGGFATIVDRTEKVIKSHNDSLIAIFAEGKTSGKSNESHPYALLPFHSGMWAISAELSRKGINIPVITAYQYWNPYSGFEIGIVGIDRPSQVEDRERMKQYAADSQNKMQEALNKRIATISPIKP